MISYAGLLVALLMAAPAPAQAYKAPLTPQGHPDLQGLWDSDSMTRLERPKGFQALVATPGKRLVAGGSGHTSSEPSLDRRACEASLTGAKVRRAKSG